MYIQNPDGTGLEKISHDNGFDAFPMFSPDGKKIVFSSNRNNGGGHGINVFIADWVE
jgi:Tol biopolymer transport system component